MTELPDAVAALLLDMELEPEERASINAFELLDLEYPNGPCPVWAEHGAMLTAHFAKGSPGRRPSRWWRYDAPEETRLRLSGTGTESWFSGAPRCGVPKFVTAEDAEWLTDVSPIDPADPPRYESQASFLRRFGLFLRGEEKRLPADAYEPEVVLG